LGSEQGGGLSDAQKLWGSHSRTNKVKVVADLAGVTIETTPDFEFGKTNKTPEYLALNPFGKVHRLRVM
jgi:glutathione S-transferase